jgi:hypothetical protein
MISETIGLVKSALTNNTYGVNVFLNSGSLPTIASAYSETTDYWMTVGGEPPVFPVLMVSLAEDVNFLMPEVRTSIRDVEITLAISYWNKITSTHTGIDLSYKTLNCVMQCLRQWSKNENSAARVDGNVQIIEMSSVRQTPRVVNQDQDVNILSSLLITFRVRDTNP